MHITARCTLQRAPTPAEAVGQQIQGLGHGMDCSKKGLSSAHHERTHLCEVGEPLKAPDAVVAQEWDLRDRHLKVSIQTLSCMGRPAIRWRGASGNGRAWTLMMKLAPGYLDPWHSSCGTPLQCSWLCATRCRSPR